VSEVKKTNMMLEFALVSLQRRWQKQLAIIGIYSVVVAFYASVIFFTQALQHETQAVLKGLPAIWVQELRGGRLSPLPTAIADSLRNIRGVKDVFVRYWGYLPESSSGAVLTIMACPKNWEQLELVQLQNPQQGSLKDDEVLVGSGILALRNLKIGDYLTISEVDDSIQSFKIVGAFEASADLLTKDLLIFSVPTARRLLGLDSLYSTDLALQVYNQDEATNIATKIDQHFPNLRVVTQPQLAATYQALWGWRSSIFLYGSLMALFAFLILVWEKAAGLNNEEQKELGILKGIGWSIQDVLRLKVYEAGVIAISATLLGILLALIHVFVLDVPLFKPLLVGWSVLYPAFQVSPVIQWESILLVSSLSIVPYLTAAIIPAWKAAIIDPATAMN
jgi:ABC-type lipoprotein release transport system permease subunit